MGSGTNPSWSRSHPGKKEKPAAGKKFEEEVFTTECVCIQRKDEGRYNNFQGVARIQDKTHSIGRAQ